MREKLMGVFLCDCGGEISSTIDMSQLAESASNLKGVKFVKRHSFLCGDEGKSLIKTAIEDGVDGIVVAACSPKLYETTFRKSLSDSGLNPHLLEMVNIREQCAWPHSNDFQGANEKAKRMVAAGIEKAKKITAVESKEFQIHRSALVIGAGVAGLQAAMDIAEFGFEVHLIEKAPIIGGNALKLGLAFPTDDGSFCISSPWFLPGIRKCFYRANLPQHPNLKIHTLSEISGFKGSFGNFEVNIISHPRGVSENLCINCGKCVKVCPVDVDDEMNYCLNSHKAIYLPYPNSAPPVYVIDWEKCTRCGKCVEVCPTNAVNLENKVKESTLKVGAIAVATGFQEYDPSGIKRYNYGLKGNVMTQLQLARILDPFGPTAGKLVRPSDSKAPKSIVMIQCVGSRDVNTNPYCSKVCCMIALKHAIQIKEEYAPDAEVYVCYMDIRAPGKGYENYFSRAREAGVTFIRGKPSKVLKDPKSGNLRVEVEDTLLNMPLRLEADMVVFSVAMVPTKSSQKLADTLGIEVGPDGFVKELYPKLRPVETSVKGIYVCGAAQAPKDIPESITQAEAIAFRIIRDLSMERLEKDMDIAFVNEDDCDGCKVCVDVCPFDAIQMVDVKTEGSESKSVARINEVRCDRCGSCASRCPTGAIQLARYSDELVLSQLSELLSGDRNLMSPKVIAFCCDECGYATVDLAGMSRENYSTSVLPVRVPCLGWVSLYQIFKALELGADGVLLVGCMPEQCQHLKGVEYAEQTMRFAKDILDEIGLGSSRIKMVNVCAANPKAFSSAAQSLVNELKGFKPIPKTQKESVSAK